MDIDDGRAPVLVIKNGRPAGGPSGTAALTLTVALPAVAMSLAEILAVSWVLLTSVVGRSLPFHCTTDPAPKPEPPTNKSKSCSPAGRQAGLIPKR